MPETPADTLATTALLLLDLQNDFLHPHGAYARGGQTSEAIAALPARLEPLADAVRQGGGLVVATYFTLVPGRGGEPIISPHLKKLRPFLRRGDFAPGSFGPAARRRVGAGGRGDRKDRLLGLLYEPAGMGAAQGGIDRLYAAGIVTNGGVASTVRDAHVREFACTVLDDGCAAFSDEIHRAAIEGLRPVARIMTIAQAMDEVQAMADARTAES